MIYGILLSDGVIVYSKKPITHGVLVPKALITSNHIPYFVVTNFILQSGATVTAIFRTDRYKDEFENE